MTLPPVEVLIVTGPDAACCTVGTWASTAGLMKQRLLGRFPGQVAVEHVIPDGSHAAELPSAATGIPSGVPLPLVMVDGRLVSHGGKLAERSVVQAIVEALARRSSE